VFLEILKEMKEVRSSGDNITFGRVPVPSLKRWCFILHKCMHMRLTDSVSKLSSLFIKSAKDPKSKKEKVGKGDGKRKRGAGKKSGKNATFDIGSVMMHNLTSGTDMEKKVHSLYT
jgi:hypothetical protein